MLVFRSHWVVRSCLFLYPFRYMSRQTNLQITFTFAKVWPQNPKDLDAMLTFVLYPTVSFV